MPNIDDNRVPGKKSNIDEIDEIMQRIEADRSAVIIQHLEKKDKDSGFRVVLKNFGIALKKAAISNSSDYLELAKLLERVTTSELSNIDAPLNEFNNKLEQLKNSYETEVFAQNLKVTLLGALLIILIVGSFALGCVCLFHPALIVTVGIGTAAAIAYALPVIPALMMSFFGGRDLFIDKYKSKKEVFERGNCLAGFFNRNNFDGQSPLPPMGRDKGVFKELLPPAEPAKERESLDLVKLASGSALGP